MSWGSFKFLEVNMFVICTIKMYEEGKQILGNPSLGSSKFSQVKNNAWRASPDICSGGNQHKLQLGCLKIFVIYFILLDKPYRDVSLQL